MTQTSRPIGWLAKSAAAHVRRVRNRFRTHWPTFPIFVQAGLGVALVLWSYPQLQKLYIKPPKELVLPETLRLISDCRELTDSAEITYQFRTDDYAGLFNFNENIRFSDYPDDHSELEIEWYAVGVQDFETKCHFVQVFWPGVLKSVFAWVGVSGRTSLENAIVNNNYDRGVTIDISNIKLEPFAIKNWVQTIYQ